MLGNIGCGQKRCHVSLINLAYLAYKVLCTSDTGVDSLTSSSYSLPVYCAIRSSQVAHKMIGLRLCPASGHFIPTMCLYNTPDLGF